MSAVSMHDLCGASGVRECKQVTLRQRMRQTRPIELECDVTSLRTAAREYTARDGIEQSELECARIIASPLRSWCVTADALSTVSFSLAASSEFLLRLNPSDLACIHISPVSRGSQHLPVSSRPLSPLPLPHLVSMCAVLGALSLQSVAASWTPARLLIGITTAIGATIIAAITTKWYRNGSTKSSCKSSRTAFTNDGTSRDATGQLHLRHAARGEPGDCGRVLTSATFFVLVVLS